MRNITALEFARLYSNLVLFDTLSREELAAKLREIADMVESKPPRLVLHEAYSMESATEKIVTETTLLLHFHQHFEEGLAENRALQEILDKKRLTKDRTVQKALDEKRQEILDKKRRKKGEHG